MALIRLQEDLTRTRAHGVEQEAQPPGGHPDEAGDCRREMTGRLHPLPRVEGYRCKCRISGEKAATVAVMP
jgi:hypothetical protein